MLRRRRPARPAPRAALAAGLLLLGACAAAPPPDPSPATAQVSLEALSAADALFARAGGAYGQRRYARAAELFARAGEAPGYWRREAAFYNAASAYALAGDAASALDYLGRAVAAGFRGAGHMAGDADLRPLHGDARWAQLLAAARGNEARYRAERDDPANARVVAEDVERFWRAYDLAARRASDRSRGAVFLREYLERGTPGLLDYYRLKIGSPEALAAFVARHPRYYRGVRESTLRAARMEPEIRAAFARLEELYPEAVFPDVYLVVGRLSSGGTVSGRGLLIGTEMYGVTPETPTDELHLGLRRIVGPPEDLPHTVAHELVHVQQAPLRDRTLLAGALREGGADFLADLVVPRSTPPFYAVWGAAHERDVWETFAAEMHQTDWRGWIGNNGTATEAWPADLGYFVGYRIAQEYYARAADKPAAFRALLRLDDPAAILRESGYAERFAR
ncbi:MAG: hypothetical protein AB1941_25560 [Gemmatimonadota bacterium]